MATLYVVSFEDFTPPAKYDGHAWNRVQIEEAPDPDGPWAIIDVINLSPIDADPTEPAARNFTTALATLPNGWYRATFLDSLNAQGQPSDPIQNIEDETAPYLPSIADLASIMRARTKDNNGNEVGTFTDKTRPTSEEARRAIAEAADDVTSPIDTDLPPRAYRYVNNAILYRAAMLVEIGSYPEQIATGRSPFEQYRELFDEAAGNLIKAVDRERSEEETGEAPGLDPGLTRYTFPPATGIDTKVW